MGGAHLVHNPDLVVLIGRGHKIDKRRVKIHIVRHQDSVGFELLPEISKLEVLVFITMRTVVQKRFWPIYLNTIARLPQRGDFLH